jgi:hypothetical protein
MWDDLPWYDLPNSAGTFSAAVLLAIGVGFLVAVTTRPFAPEALQPMRVICEQGDTIAREAWAADDQADPYLVEVRSCVIAGTDTRVEVLLID